MNAKTNKAEVATQVVDDPVRLNELNQEPWYQSGVGVYSTGGILWSVGTILIQVSEHGSNYPDYNLEVMVVAIGGLASAVGVLYRRFYPNLKPMFHRIIG